MILRRAQRIWLAAVLIALTGGCATPTHLATPRILPDDGTHPAAFARAEATLRQLFPARYRATQRAIVTVRGRQFTCDALLEVSPTGGLHLAIVSSFGVVTEVRVARDGGCELLKVTPLFREDWSRRFVARDLRWLFIAPASLQPAGQLVDGSVVLQTPPDSSGGTARYIFSADGTRWRELDLMQNDQSFYQAILENFRKFPGMTEEIPGRFEVGAEAYRLELQMTGLTVTQEAPP
jgi:hypothetical protein